MSKWLTEKEAAAYTRLAAGTLRNWRMYGLGPQFTKLPSGGIRYAADELERWMSSGSEAA